MRVLGIDPGSRVTGWGVVEIDDGALKLIESGTIRTGDGEAGERLFQIYAGLKEIIHRLRPQSVAVEGVFHARDAQAALKLGQARGVALLAAAEKRLAVHEYSPMTVKQAVTGRGRADKQQVQEMVRHIARLDRLPASDAADALAVAICHIQQSAFSDQLSVTNDIERGPRVR